LEQKQYGKAQAAVSHFSALSRDASVIGAGAVEMKVVIKITSDLAKYVSNYL
jgi:hypothetical protein